MIKNRRKINLVCETFLIVEKDNNELLITCYLLTASG